MKSIGNHLRRSRATALLFFATITLSLQTTWSDVKRSPNDKPKETTKDFRKDQDKNGFGTPEAKNGTANFVSGLSVDVVLEVDTAYLGLVKFSLRDLPQHGKLSEIRQHPTALNKAIVTYIHDANSGQLIDRFTFVAKLSEGSSSAPGVISLVGKRADPILEVIKQPIFKRTEPGSTDKGVLVLRNKGFATYSQDIIWPPPWQGPPRIEVNIGEEREFLIAVKPPAPGAYTFEKDLQTGLTASHIKCYVECVQAFAVSPGSMELKFDPATGKRSGSVQVSNSSETPLKLTVKVPGRLHAINELLLEPKKVAEVAIDLEENDVAAFRGELWFEQLPFREKVIVSAEPEPAQLQLIAPIGANTDLGILKKGEKKELKVILANLGGSNAEISMLVPPPFTLLSESKNMTIEPRKTLEFGIAFTPEQPGSYDSRIVIDGNAGKMFLNLKASMMDSSKPSAAPAVQNPKTVPFRPAVTSPAPKTAATSSPAPASRPTTLQVNAPPERATPSAPTAAAVPVHSGISSPQNAGDAALNNYLSNFGLGAETLPQFASSKLKRIEHIGLVDATPESITVGWVPPADTPPKSYSLQVASAVLNQPSGRTFKTWKPIKEWEPVDAKSGILAGKVSNLQPEYKYEFRVLGVDDDGKFSKASDILIVTTPAPTKLPGWVWPALIVLLGSIAIVLLRRMQDGHWQRSK